jgi:hypothetical protein
MIGLGEMTMISIKVVPQEHDALPLSIVETETDHTSTLWFCLNDTVFHEAQPSFVTPLAGIQNR